MPFPPGTKLYRVTISYDAFVAAPSEDEARMAANQQYNDIEGQNERDIQATLETGQYLTVDDLESMVYTTPELAEHEATVREILEQAVTPERRKEIFDAQLKKAQLRQAALASQRKP